MKWFCLIVLLNLGCSNDPKLPGFIDTLAIAPINSPQKAVHYVASDERLLSNAIIIAGRNGILRKALLDASKDSSIGIKMRETLILDYEKEADSIQTVAKRIAKTTTSIRRAKVNQHAKVSMLQRADKLPQQ